MIELKRFQLPLTTCRSKAFDFEGASMDLLARHQRRDAIAVNLPMSSEWRDPPAFRLKTTQTTEQQGVHHHG